MRPLAALIALTIAGCGATHPGAPLKTNGSTPRAHGAGGPGVPRTARAKAAALAYWGQVPCGGRYTATIVDVPAGFYAFSASIPEPPDNQDRHLRNGTAATYQSFTACTIRLARKAFGAGHHVPFYLYCQVFVHEYGHLLGFREQPGTDGGIHSANPRNVMFDTGTSNSTPSVCKGPGSGYTRYGDKIPASVRVPQWRL